MQPDLTLSDDECELLTYFRLMDKEAQEGTLNQINEMNRKADEEYYKDIKK